MRIDEIMTRDPACVTPGTTVRDVAKLMQREDTGAVPVVESNDSRRLVGMVTDREFAIGVVAYGRDGETRVSEVMSGGRLATVDTSASVDDVMERMADEQVRRIPVVDERGALVGIVSQADVVRKARDDSKAEQTVEDISRPSGRHQQ